MRLAAVFLAASALFAADLPLAGTWKLNRAKSKFSVGQLPKSLVITIEALPNGLRYTSQSVTSEDRQLGMTYEAKFDGRDYPIRDNERYDAVAWTRVDARTYLAVTKKNGQTVGSTKYSVAADGKTFTRTGTAQREGGEPNKYSELFERQ